MKINIHNFFGALSRPLCSVSLETSQLTKSLLAHLSSQIRQSGQRVLTIEPTTVQPSQNV